MKKGTYQFPTARRALEIIKAHPNKWAFIRFRDGSGGVFGIDSSGQLYARTLWGIKNDALITRCEEVSNPICPPCKAYKIEDYMFIIVVTKRNGINMLYPNETINDPLRVATARDFLKYLQTPADKKCRSLIRKAKGQAPRL